MVIPYKRHFISLFLQQLMRVIVDHVNFVANDKQLGPIVVSIERPKKEENKSVSRVNARVLVRSRDVRLACKFAPHPSLILPFGD